MLRSCVAFSAVLACVLAFSPALAGTTGKIAGTVTDVQTGEALFPANIILEGTVLGGVSTDVGNYFIINVQPGTYTVTAKMIGYQDVRKQNIVVFPDFTTEVDFEMQQTAFELGEAIEVTQERPLVQPDRTSSATFITAEDISILPVRGYQEATAVQSGVVNFEQDLAILDNSTEESRNGATIVVRGGRPNQVGYFVDGFLQQDLLTGISTTSINSDAISEVVFLRGGFDAEYGRFQSGIVNVITKEGSGELFGSIEGITDNLAGDWVGADNTDYNIYAGAIGGPILNTDHTFFASGERQWLGDRSPSAVMDEVADRARSALGGGDVTFAEQRVIDGYADNTQPSNHLDRWNWQGKLAFRLSDDAKVLLGTQGSYDQWQRYSHSYVFNREHAQRFDDRNFSGFARYTHNLGANTFYNAAFNLFYTERKAGDGVHLNRLARYARPGGNPRFDDFSDLFFNVDDPETPVVTSSSGVVTDGDEGHIFDDYLRRISWYAGGSFDLTRQMDRYNQVKIGGDFRRHTLRRYQHFFPVQLFRDDLTIRNPDDLDRYGFDIVAIDEHEGGGFVGDLDGTKHPIELSFFLQDKIEYEGLVVKGGVRYDYINTDTPALVDFQRPLDADPSAAGAVTGALDATDLTDNEVYHRVSPRVGVAFPVSVSTVIHFNYGKFFQPPTLENLYVSYDFLEHKVGTGGYFVDFGNPNLQPEETTAYEAGIAQEVGDNAAVSITSYYKKVEDLIQVRNIPSLATTTVSYSSYQNTDFGTIKGVDVDYTMRRSDRTSATLAYSLSFANGTGSLPGTQRDIAWTAGDPPKQTFPLDFDQRHKMSMNVDYRFGDDDGPMWGTVHPFSNVGVNVLFNVASGTPYTPTRVFNEVTLAAVASQPNGAVNSAYGPWNYRVDLKGDKGFRVGPMDMNAYIWVINLLDRDNAVTVYTSSGSARTTRFLNTPNGQAFVQDNAPTLSDADAAAFYQFKELNPLYFSLPRLVRFGLKASF